MSPTLPTPSSLPEESVRSAEGGLLLRASDFLRGGKPWYAGRARRKKIALVELEARNTSAGAITVDFSRARLSVEGRSFDPEKGEVVVRKLSTFQWDFLFYWILHFSLIELAIELSIFFAGALYNRSLRKRLGSILERQVTLQPGEGIQGLLAFGKVAPFEAADVEVPWSAGGAGLEWARRRVEC